jgi:glutaconate CoA-transferase, subunit A
MSKRRTMSEAIAECVTDGASVAIGLAMEQMIPFAAGHEIIRQNKRDLTLVGPISDILFDQMIVARCVSRIIAAWVGNVMMGSAYNFRRGVESGAMQVTNMSNFTVALALQAAAMGVPFLPTRSAMGSDIVRDNPFFVEMQSPFPPYEKLHAIKALAPDVAIVQVQRADENGNAHCWGNLGVMIEGVRAAKKVIVVAEEIVSPEVITSDPNRTVIPELLVSAVVECPLGAHPSPVQGYYSRDNAYYHHYHEQTKTVDDSRNWLDRHVHEVRDRTAYLTKLGECRVDGLRTKQHAYAATTDYGY